MEQSDLIPIPALPKKRSFLAMPPSEARRYFAWHMETMDARIRNMETILGLQLDRSPDSLSLLWQGIRDRHDRVKGRAEAEAQMDALLFCAGLYLCEVLRTNHPQLSWTCCKRRIFCWNRPVLQGFGHVYFDPRHMIQVQASKLYRGEGSETQLLDLFEIWIKNLH